MYATLHSALQRLTIRSGYNIAFLYVNCKVYLYVQFKLFIFRLMIYVHVFRIVVMCEIKINITYDIFNVFIEQISNSYILKSVLFIMKYRSKLNVGTFM